MDQTTSPVVLLVEDEALLMIEAESILKDAGFDVRTATSGALALSEVERGEANGLVTDVNLGTGPCGWEVARRGREINPQLPVVYMSGESSAQWASQGVPNSVMLTKPFAASQLVTAISTLMNEVSTTVTE